MIDPFPLSLLPPSPPVLLITNTHELLLFVSLPFYFYSRKVKHMKLKKENKTSQNRISNKTNEPNKRAFDYSLWVQQRKQRNNFKRLLRLLYLLQSAKLNFSRSSFSQKTSPLFNPLHPHTLFLFLIVVSFIVCCYISISKSKAPMVCFIMHENTLTSFLLTDLLFCFPLGLTCHDSGTWVCVCLVAPNFRSRLESQK